VTAAMPGTLTASSRTKAMNQLATLDRLWAEHRIRLCGPYPDVFIVKDLGACVERVWTGQDWGKEPKRYPTLQAAFDDLPTIPELRP